MSEEKQEHTPTPLEALTILIHAADRMKGFREAHPSDQSGTERFEKEEAALSVVNSVLNTALPIARFRAFVQVDKDSIAQKSPIRNEYTVCSVDIDGILSGLLGLLAYRTDVHVSLWEQRAMGADMLSAYQGPTKGSRYRSWLESLSMFRFVPTPTEEETTADEA